MPRVQAVTYRVPVVCGSCCWLDLDLFGVCAEAQDRTVIHCGQWRVSVVRLWRGGVTVECPSCGSDRLVVVDTQPDNETLECLDCGAVIVDVG